MENRRLLFAVFLSALILILWNFIFPPVPPPERSAKAPPPEAADSQQMSPSLGTEEASEAELLGEDDAGGLDREAQSLIDFGEDVVASEHEERPVLENESARLEISSLGAQLVSYRLKREKASGEGGLELVRDRGSDPYPFSLIAGGDKHRLNKAFFVWEQESDGADGVLRFRHRSDRGAAEKVFRLKPSGLLEVELTVLGDRNWSMVMGPGLRNLTEKEAGNRFVQHEVGYRRGEESETISPKKQDADEFLPSLGLRWVTLEDNFFLVAVMPESGVQQVIVRPVLQRVELRKDQPRFLPIDAQIDEEGLTREQLLLLEASGQQMEVQAFFGAKRYSQLVKQPFGLEQTVRWGFFGFLAKPLYFALEWIHQSIVANYGWAIVLVTCLIRILFFPLTVKSQESMGKMQELNPKVQAIRNKYRSKLKDRQGRPNAEAQRQMNEEVMSVYKSAGVNPASGCLPVLLQMPVFFAFFRLLSTAVELRNASWIGWIKDLSVPDPYYVLPLVMGVTSVAMQRMMPASPDPMQRRIMQIFPLMFTFFAFAFPSGLVLYWVTNNLLSMIQQGAMMKLKKRREASA